MKRPFALLLAGACFASACLASPEPPETPPAEETAIEPEAPPIIRPLVGGGCAYETTVIAASVAAVYDNTIQLSDPAARTFNLPPTVFVETPLVGDTVNVTKRKITKGACQPLVYTYAGPDVALTPEAPVD